MLLILHLQETTLHDNTQIFFTDRHEYERKVLLSYQISDIDNFTEDHVLPFKNKNTVFLVKYPSVCSSTCGHLSSLLWLNLLGYLLEVNTTN